MDAFRSIRVKAMLVLLLVVLAGSIAGATLVMARDSGEFKSEVITGLNRVGDKVLYELDFMPSPFKERFGFEPLGVFNPAGPDPLPLTASTPENAVLASFADITGVGLPPAVLGSAAPELINVPLRDIATWVLPPNLVTRSAVPFQSDGPINGATQAEPNGPITKGDWFNASGKLKVKCSSEGNSVRINVKGLVPHRLYTFWAIWLDPSVPRFIPIPLGGAPNSYVTDEKGDATFERELNFCLTDAAKEGVDGKTLAFIDTHLHSDQVAYGGIPAPIAAGFPPGTVLHAQLTWSLGAGERVID